MSGFTDVMVSKCFASGGCIIVADEVPCPLQGVSQCTA